MPCPLLLFFWTPKSLAGTDKGGGIGGIAPPWAFLGGGRGGQKKWKRGKEKRGKRKKKRRKKGKKEEKRRKKGKKEEKMGKKKKKSEKKKCRRGKLEKIGKNND